MVAFLTSVLVGEGGAPKSLAYSPSFEDPVDIDELSKLVPVLKAARELQDDLLIRYNDIKEGIMSLIFDKKLVLDASVYKTKALKKQWAEEQAEILRVALRHVRRAWYRKVSPDAHPYLSELPAPQRTLGANSRGRVVVVVVVVVVVA
ncbi:unnamed protein product, partial [Prorocentrum cordatum]